MLFSKVGKALDIKNVKIVSLRTRSTYLATELKAYKLVTRKKVRINVNKRFITI